MYQVILEEDKDNANNGSCTCGIHDLLISIISKSSSYVESFKKRRSKFGCSKMERLEYLLHGQGQGNKTVKSLENYEEGGLC